MANEHTPDADELVGKLVDFDQALADGSTAAVHSGTARGGLSANDSARLRRAEQCLELIERVRRDVPAETALGGGQLPTIGRFRIIRELGRGGFGIVLLARDPHLERDVALKVPHPDVLLSESLRARFLREGRAAASLRHPNIVPVYEAEHAGPICYLVSEYCPGPTLAEWLQHRDEPVDPRQAARLVRDMALAVAHAHRRGVIHRDLKPSNVLLYVDRSDGRADEKDLRMLTPLVADFGMARIVDSVADRTQSGATPGTPAYMSPEQAAGDVAQVGPASDVYALGAILYELLAGVRPFRRPTTLATLRAIQFDAVEPPGRLRRLPAGLEAACLKCLAKEPGGRYGSAADLAAALDDCLSAGFVAEPQSATKHALAESTCHTSSKLVRARWMIAACVALAIVAGLTRAARRPHSRDAISTSGFAPRGRQPHVGRATLVPTDVGDADRRVAEALLRLPGTVSVSITVDGRGTRVASVDQLPAEPFAVQFAQLSGIKSLDESLIDRLATLKECSGYDFINTPLADEHLPRLAADGVTHLQLYGTQVTDDGLRHLAGFRNLNSLSLRSPSFTDDAVRHVARLPKLTRLGMAHSQLTDGGLARLADLHGLRELNLWHSQNVSDLGLSRLSALSHLETLVLNGTHVIDAGVFALKARLPACAIHWDSQAPDIRATFSVLQCGGAVRAAVDDRVLNIKTAADFPPRPFLIREIDLRDARRVSDSVLDLLRSLEHVETLRIGVLGHTESGLAFVADLPSVRRLIVHGASDADVPHLGLADQIDILEIVVGKVTRGREAALRAALPQCDVLLR